VSVDPWEGPVRNLLLVLSCVWLLSGCAEIDDAFAGDSGRDGYYGGNNNYGGGYYGGNSGYHNPGYGNYGGYNNGYYPYGNANYPRDRIYVITPYGGCNGYAYEGYCYRDKDDYRNAIVWDQNHQNDVNWNKKRKDWCNAHDCRRSHDTRYPYHGTTDAQGRPLVQPVEKKGAERYPYPSTPAAKPVPYGQPKHQRDPYRSGASGSEQGGSSRGDSSRGGVSNDGNQNQGNSHQQRGKSHRSESYQPQSYQPQPSVQPYAPPTRHKQNNQHSQPVDGGSSGQSGKSQRKQGGRSVDMGATPE